MSLSHLVLWSESAGDLENETHQSNPRKDKRVDDVPVRTLKQKGEEEPMFEGTNID